MADLSKLKLGTNVYTLKDAQARTDVATAQGAIAAEVTRATGAESGLDTRIKALESKGRYLSTWNAITGLPETYPQDSQFVEGKYNYRAGDYYIVNKVAAKVADNLMPDGAYITKEGTTYTVPTKAFTGNTLNLGDQFQFDGTSWTHIASATTVAFANIQGDAEENANLKGKLDAKANVADLGALAYKDSASGTVAGQTITGVKATGNLTASLTGALKIEDTEVASSGTFTPAGTITGDAIKGGSINVTVKDASAATAVTDLTYENYTPAGTVSAKATGGTSSVLASATFEADANGTAVSGTVSKPNVTITAGTEKTFATGLTGGSVAQFTEGAFTPASISEGFFSPGSHNFGTFKGGAASTLTAATTGSFNTDALKAHIASGEEIEGEVDAETLIFEAAATSSAVTDRGTFTEGSAASWTGYSYTAPSIDTSKFSGGEKAADSFTANTLQSVETGTVHDTPTAALAEAPTFTGDKFRVATTTDTVLKDVEFAGTAAAVKLTGAKYLKQEIDVAEFTGTAATLGFTGTAGDVDVAGQYEKTTLGTLGASAEIADGGLSVGTITVESRTVTVE